MRPVYVVGNLNMSEWDMARLKVADRFHGAPIVIVDGRYHEAPMTPAARPRRSVPTAVPVTDPTYVDRAKAAAEAKRARKAARRPVSA